MRINFGILFNENFLICKLKYEISSAVCQFHTIKFCYNFNDQHISSIIYKTIVYWIKALVQEFSDSEFNPWAN